VVHLRSASEEYQQPCVQLSLVKTRPTDFAVPRWTSLILREQKASSAVAGSLWQSAANAALDYDPKPGDFKFGEGQSLQHEANIIPDIRG
jgi:hypothetical protein